MFCPTCGSPFKPESRFCGACGTSATPEIGPKFKEASRDALSAFTLLAIDPVSGLPRAFEGLPAKRSLAVGIFFAGVFDFAIAIGLYLGLPRWSKPAGADLIKLLLLGLAPVISIACASALARTLCRGGGSPAGDIFVAGAAVLPFAALALLAGLLGIGNAEVIAILGSFAACYTVLLLYSGCTRISKIPDRAAAPAVASMILLSAWLTKVIVVALL